MLNYLLAKLIGYLPFHFKGVQAVIKILWPPGGYPVIREISTLSVSKMKIYTDSRNEVEWAVLVQGCYEKDLVETMIKLNMKTRRQVAIDVGANVGQYSLILSKYFKKVYSFEPVPDFYQKLEANIRLNNLSNVIIKPFALGLSEGEIEMAVMENNSLAQTASRDRGKYHFKDNFSWRKTSAKQVSLDAVLAEEKDCVDYIKIDTDGSEYEVLLGSENLLRNHRPIIQIELQDYVKEWLGDATLNDIVKLLEHYEYVLLDRRGKLYTSRNYGGDYFALPKERCEKGLASDPCNLVGKPSVHAV